MMAPHEMCARPRDSLTTDSSTTSVGLSLVESEDALEPETASARIGVAEPHARLAAVAVEHLVLPRERGNLAVERDAACRGRCTTR